MARRKVRARVRPASVSTRKVDDLDDVTVVEVNRRLGIGRYLHLSPDGTVGALSDPDVVVRHRQQLARFVSGRSPSWQYRQRPAGWEQVLAEHGLPVPEVAGR
jgi:hypothetical protein